MITWISFISCQYPIIYIYIGFENKWKMAFYLNHFNSIWNYFPSSSFCSFFSCFSFLFFFSSPIKNLNKTKEREKEARLRLRSERKKQEIESKQKGKTNKNFWCYVGEQKDEETRSERNERKFVVARILGTNQYFHPWLTST